MQGRPEAGARGGTSAVSGMFRKAIEARAGSAPCSGEGKTAGKMQKSTSRVLFFALSRIALHAGNETGFQRSGADVNALRFTIYENAHFLNVNTPFAASSTHGVGASVSSFARLASYKATTCHCDPPPLAAYKRDTRCEKYKHLLIVAHPPVNCNT